MAKRVLTIVSLALVVSLAEGAELRPSDTTTAASIDFEGFLGLSEDVLEARRGRLLPLEEFLARAAEPGAVLLDSRSAAAYAAKHLAGAVHLNFSDMTEQSLARQVGPRDRTVLIYCNNNFLGGEISLATKKPAAALNIPTFVTLWAYGYRDVYELGELLQTTDPRLTFAGHLVDDTAAGSR